MSVLETPTLPTRERPSSIITDQKSVTAVVLAAMAETGNLRLREIMAALVQHLHAFAREVRLTEEEYDIGIDFLNRIGQATHDAHNEGILFSDAIGFSTLVCLLNNGDGGATETASALLGPFWRENSPHTENGGSIIRCGTEGPALIVTGRIIDPEGQPLEGVEVDVWQASPVGLYENQDATQADMNLRGKFTTDRQGCFHFRSIRPAGYPVPTDGPTGDLLRAQNRHPFRPAHLHFLAFKPGHKTLITQIFVDDDQHLDTDVVFGVTRHLVGDFQRHDDGSAIWYTLDHTFVMERGDSKLPKPPIK
ncbi:catechol 1,2-dioxygenase [Skermanella stibiiresistens SB22]|uniref:Catechol 1,2-dioxygenase n=1 Tax=Skermanella stibiiresistens SB22 TaxID=1385369 RepID=W9H0E9_9PROT|nr:dioxygenase [Skermanella stibiiresistens]EWY38321.1 catechol 1,2-dioxygenase [Skermanella stibiiresistens SB22]